MNNELHARDDDERVQAIFDFFVKYVSYYLNHLDKCIECEVEYSKMRVPTTIHPVCSNIHAYLLLQALSCTQVTVNNLSELCVTSWSVVSRHYQTEICG